MLLLPSVGGGGVVGHMATPFACTFFLAFLEVWELL